MFAETKKSLPAQPSSSVTFITSRQRDRKAPAGANAKVSTEEKRDQTPVSFLLLAFTFNRRG